MKAQFIIRGPVQRNLIGQAAREADLGTVVTFKPLTRSLDQNAKMWAMLSDISKAKPMGREHDADRWKMVMMQACGHEVQFELGLDGRPFPVGMRTSHLTVPQMADLITFIQQKGDEWGVPWSPWAQI